MSLSPKLVVAGLAIAAAQAVTATPVITTSSLTGFVSVEGFADGSPESFSITARDLAGTINAVVLPPGSYDVSVQGTVSFTGFAGPGGTISATIADPLSIFSGAVVPTGATPGSYSFTYTPGDPDVNDMFLGSYGFSVSYDGSTTTEVLGFLNALFGAGFVDPTGSGTITVDGDIFTDGFTMNVVESDLTWAGFGAIALGIDGALGGGNGIIDGSFSVRDVVVTAVPAPATLALSLAALGLMAGLRRRAG